MDTVPPLVGKSPPIEALRDLLAQIGPAPVTVLITGETGTGKEVVARWLHHLSRRPGPFVAVNCAAIPDTLYESELFGHERGAFTGAHTALPGRFEDAHRGTLFLDEFAETSPQNQVKLLRALQDSEIQRVGGHRPRSVDVRVLAASNRNIASALASGTLREDLFYRLSVIQIHLPPLRDRREDIGPLTAHFAEAFARRHGRPRAELDPAALECLETHGWPGNVRELENAVLRATVVAGALGDPVIRPRHLPPALSGRDSAAAGALIPSPELHLGLAIQRLRHRYTIEALKRTAGNRARAARLLGVSRRGLYNLLEDLTPGERAAVAALTPRLSGDG